VSPIAKISGKHASKVAASDVTVMIEAGDGVFKRPNKLPRSGGIGALDQAIRPGQENMCGSHCNQRCDRGVDASASSGAVVQTIAEPPPSMSAVQVPTQAASASQTAEQQPQVVQRTVTVTFDYDFSKYPPCSAKVTKKCIQQFNVWEVSDPTKQLFLFTVPVPPDSKGMVKGITWTSPNKRVFFTGPRRFGVSAKTPEPGPRDESNPRLCMAFGQVLPDNPASPASDSSSPQK
jgi:hypothetical protein